MTTTLDAQFARSWVSRWDAQQERYVADREERFAVIGDVVADVVRTGRQGATVVDLGCGPGSLSARLADRLPGLRIIGLDGDPLLLALGRARYGYRVEFVDTDLSDELPEQVPPVIDAAVSTTALHWLDQEPLAALYRRIATRIRPGGVFVNGDHMPASDPALRELVHLVREGRNARAGSNDHEDWGAWWAAVQAEPELADLISEHSQRAITHHGGNQLSPAEHAELLLAAGFRSVGSVYQHGDDTVLVAIR